MQCLAATEGLLIIMTIRAMKSNCPNVSPDIILPDVPVVMHLVYSHILGRWFTKEIRIEIFENACQLQLVASQ